MENLTAKEVTIHYLESIVKEKQNLLDNYDFPEINIHKMEIVRLKKVIDVVKESEGE